MLRVTIQGARPLVVGAPGLRAGPQWASAQRRTRPKQQQQQQRPYSGSRKPDEILVPGSQSKSVAGRIPEPPGKPSVAAPTSSRTVLPEDVPKVPPTPKEVGAVPAASLLPSSSTASTKTATATTTTPLPSARLGGRNIAKAPLAAATSSPPPPPPPPAVELPVISTASSPKSAASPRRRGGRFGRFLRALIILSGLGYTGGVYYSLHSDNFHDFFTEYVPFGEDAVGYFEERQFKKRFQNQVETAHLQPQTQGENKVTIPSNSGLSWRVRKDEDSGRTHDISTPGGSHVSALFEPVPGSQTPIGAQEARKLGQEQKTETKDLPQRPRSVVSQSGLMPGEAKGASKADGNSIASAKASAAESRSRKASSDTAQKSAPESAKKARAPAVIAAPDAASEPSKASQEQLVNKTSAGPETTIPVVRVVKTAPAPPPPAPALPLIDRLKVESAEEPVVQEVVNMLNGIILAINADNSSGRFASIIGKAKEDVTKMIGDIASLKQRHEKAAREQIRSVHQEFDEAARQLIQRFEGETKEQEVRWKEEYENERERLSAGYEQRLKTALGASEQLYEQRLRNELLEQSTALTRSFTDRVQETIEKERNGRLSKLSELQSSMEQVQQLTAGSTELVETTLNTQRLHVALDAVTAKLAAAQGPVPFGPELAALKDAAGPSSALVAAALASIAPLAYNRGLPTAGQLRVRFTDVASEVRKAALLPENAGIASHAVSRVLGVFLLRKDGAPVGDDVESVLARATHQLDQGDLEGAARELNTLTGWAKLLAGDWLRDVRGVCEVQQALDVVAAEARLQSLLAD